LYKDMGDFDPFNAKPTEWAERLSKEAMREAQAAIHMTQSPEMYQQNMARALTHLSDAVSSLAVGLRATYILLDKMNKRVR
jgi:cytosine/adenosine deaminase-related metal-dependent hydrolase